MISVVCILIPVLELKYILTNFKIYWIFYLLMKQNTHTKNLFAPLDHIQSDLLNTIHRIHLPLFAVKSLIF